MPAPVHFDGPLGGEAWSPEAQDELGVFLGDLDTQATRFDERRAALLARRAAGASSRA
ncbi:hypothetical protein ABT154_19490 [Streptomyces sp. NPDC001728]|uniref:hypothetical protein n=1 Tax=Streptomyces sp. NPDC001728 TaxID=3154396 RepID=UPI00331FAA70